MYKVRRKDCGLLIYCLEQDKHPNPIIPASCDGCNKFYSVFDNVEQKDGDSIKCIGVYRDCHYYYDGRNNQFFLLTPNFKITRCPARYNEDVAKWCAKQREKFLRGKKNEPKTEK